jgi:periplasmic divalent cation tolerance protein
MVFIIVYITHKNEKEARKVANYLLKKRLVACANIFPVKSIFRWNGKLEDTREVVTLVKTRKENWQMVKSEVEKIHPYEVPCIMKLSAEANADYEKWIMNETR